jgi:hypothetical protein
VDSLDGWAQYWFVEAAIRPIHIEGASVTIVHKDRTVASRLAQILSRGSQPMKTFALLILVTLALAVSAPGAAAQSCSTATCTAASASESDFLAALPSSSNKNATVVVSIPAGTAAWTTGFSYTVPPTVTNLTIQGGTAVSCSGTAGTSSYSCSATDNTVIEDSANTNTALMYFATGAGNTFFRITGLTIQGGSAKLPKYGIVQIAGVSQNVRVDHSHFNNTTYSPAETSIMVRVQGQNLGVMDHNVVDLGGNTSDANGFQAFNSIGDTIGNGDGTWASPTAWGTAAFLFMENNQFNGGYPNDCNDAGTFVMRYNTFNGVTTSVQTHGTKSPAGPERGCRAYEFYHNYITGPGGSSQGDAAGGSKGGPSLFWGNTLAAGYYRLWAGATDRNSGDETETNTPNGWGYCGTLISGTGSNWDGNQSLAPGYPCLDGLGRGQTQQALNGQNFPGRLNSATGTIAWPHQLLEPVYLFMNTIQNNATEINLRDSVTALNRDVYVDNSAFVGATGTGYGVLSSRPLVCAPGLGGTYDASPTGSYGVAYFATDANGGNGELYVCSSLNTWTPIYEPYTYPHPLVSGTSSSGGNSPPAPTGLSASPQ